MPELLDNFNELDEIIRIITFQTGKNKTDIAEELGIARETFSRKTSKPLNEKANKELIIRLKHQYSKELSQFVIKYGSINSTGKGQGPELTLEDIQVKLLELAASVGKIRRKSDQMPLPELGTSSLESVAREKLKKGKSARKGKSGKDDSGKA